MSVASRTVTALRCSCLALLAARLHRRVVLYSGLCRMLLSFTWKGCVVFGVGDGMLVTLFNTYTVSSGTIPGAITCVPHTFHV